MMNLRLKDIADIQAGHPFRGSVPLVTDGGAYVLQMRDMAPNGTIAWGNLVQTRLEGRKRPSWLKPDDIVFIARGARNYAVCLTAVPKAVVCSQYFYLIRINSPKLIPAFVAWQINRAPAQHYFATHAEGSDQLSIRRGVLEELPISVPPLDKQQLIVDIHQLALHEQAHLEALIRNRQLELDTLAFELLKPSSTPKQD